MEFNELVTKLRTAGCVFAEEEARLLIFSAPSVDNLSAMIDKRISGFPLEHVIG